MVARLDPSWKGKYGWSPSSDRLWNSCRRAFFFRYVSNWQGDREYPPVEHIRRLKALTGLRLLEGRLVHETIENSIQQHRLGRELQLESMQSFYESRWQEFAEAPTENLTEGFNGMKISRDFLDFVLEDGKRQLDRFVRIVWPQLRELEYLEHEEFESFYVDDLKVHVKVDLVTRSSDGTVVVTDWKTGQQYIPDKDDLQLAVYGLWASSKFDVPLENVKLELVYLRTGRSIPVEPQPVISVEVRELVLSSSAEVLAADHFEDFPTAPSPEKCVSCSFATVCPDGGEVLEDLRAQEMLDALSEVH